MPSAAHLEALSESAAGLRGQGVVPGIVPALQAGIEATGRQLLDSVLAEIDAFSASANPDLLPEIKSHLEALAAGVPAVLREPASADVAFVRDYARRRAGQRFPLEALLHSYRCSHRVLALWIRDAALTAADPSAQVRRVVAAAADFAIEYTNAISTVATSEYVERTRLLAEAEGDLRTELLSALLSGIDEADGRMAQLLRRSGYLDQRQSFCVAVARSVDPREMENAARAQRMAEAIGEALRDSPVRTLIGIRHGLVTVVMSGMRRLSGWTAPQSLVADRVQPALCRVGPAALIGLSSDAPSTSHIRRALHEARLALDFASVSRRVMPYGEIPFRQLVAHHAREAIRSALPAWLPDLQAADRKARGALSATLFAYAGADMNTLKAAKDLGVHPNTVYARMQRIGEITGRNALQYHDLTELLLVLECAGGSASPTATARPVASLDARRDLTSSRSG